MKKIMVFILLVLLSGCMATGNSKEYDQIEVSYRISSSSTKAVLTEKDAEKAWKLIQKINSQQFSQLKQEEHYIGSVDHNIMVTSGSSKTVYSFVNDTLSVYEDGKLKEEYKIDGEFYQNTLYPELSVLINNYIPLTYQLCSSPNGWKLENNGDVIEEVSEEARETFMNEMMHGMIQFPQAEEYKGSYDGQIMQLKFTDSVISETIGLFDDFLVIRNRKIPYGNPSFPLAFDSDELLTAGKYVLLNEKKEPVLNDKGEYETFIQLNEDGKGTFINGDEVTELYYDPQKKFIHFIAEDGYDYEPTYRYSNGILRISYFTGNDMFKRIEP